jgi:nitrite reductase (NADH) large subunit
MQALRDRGQDGQEEFIAGAAADPADPSVVIVGAGPVGVHYARLLRAAAPEIPVVLYGNEPWEPYDRVQLSTLLAGQRRMDQVMATPFDTADGGLETRLNCAVTRIDRQRRTVCDAGGRTQRYRKLVLAVGSEALLPQIPGITLPGVYVLRDLGDVQRLMARRVRSRHTLVLGGGLLGLEAARAMQRLRTEVTLVHRGPWLVNRQLDAGAAALLQRHLETLGLRVLVGTGVREITGRERLDGVLLGDGTELSCDTLVVATGIRPRLALARTAGLRIGHGIQVDDSMQTSDPHIYAIGECAEHRGRVHGTLAPGLEQAGVAVHHLCGGRAAYTGSVEAAVLKVIDCPVFSTGRVGEREDSFLDRATLYQDQAHYRRVLTRAGRAVGAVAVGDWDEQLRVRELVARGGIVWPWQRWRLARSGHLWSAERSRTVANWPAGALVCQCRGISRGELGEALATGADSIAALTACTGAASVCGGCRPLLEQLLDPGAAPAARAPVRPKLAWTSLAAAAAVALVSLVPEPRLSVSIRSRDWLEQASTAGAYRQLSGYALVATVLAGLGLSLYKRTRWRWGGYDRLRLWHALSGLLALGMLVVHTGLRPGANLNFLLLGNFLAVTALGAAAGVAVALEGRLGPAGGRYRRWSIRLHLLLLWPLPALLGVHILAGYYF